MRKGTKLLYLFFAMFLVSWVSAQVPATSAQIDPYANFVGSWSGTASAKNMPSTAKVEITEEKNKNRMRLDFVFGTKEEEGYARDTKWITLDPSKEKMSSHWKGKSEVRFDTDGLAAFSMTGLGTFVAKTGMRTADSTTFAKETFDLHPNTFSYRWETSADHLHFTPYSRFEFTRDGQNSTSTSGKD